MKASLLLAVMTSCLVGGSGLGQTEPPKTAAEWFQAGLRVHKAAAISAAPARELEQAAQSYLRALQLQPEYGPALNNLAQLYVKLDRLEEAEQFFRRAVQAGGAKQPFYAANYGDFLASRGDWRGACRQYGAAAVAQPDNAAVQQKMVDACLAWSPGELGVFLWDLLQRGQILQVQKHALQVLPRENVSKDELLAIIAVCLSRQVYPPEEFETTPVGKTLAGNTDPDLTPGIAALFRVHRNPKPDPAAYSWWTKRGDSHQAAPRGMWPREAFQQLIRSLGDRQRMEDHRRAEAYYSLAAFLVPREPDPDALTRLAELYVETEQLGRLVAVMEEHEREIFDAKGAAYRDVQWDKIYRFHSALGLIYSSLGRWGDSHTPASATFQLERALAAAERRPPGSAVAPDVPAGNRPTASPQLVNLLAQSYTQSNRLQDAAKLREVKSREYFQLGDASAAQEIINPADKTMLYRPGLKEDKILEVADLAKKQTYTVTFPTKPRLSEVEQQVLGSVINDMLEQTGTQPQDNLNLQRLNLIRSPKAKIDVEALTLDNNEGVIRVQKGKKTVELPVKVEGAEKLKSIQFKQP